MNGHHAVPFDLLEPLTLLDLLNEHRKNHAEQPNRH